MAANDKNYFDPKVLAGIANLDLRARWVVEGLMSGVHKSRAKGFSVEFEEHREYSPGDEIRRIDWKALGKFDRYFIKEYEDETNLRAYLLLDASASMNYASDGITQIRLRLHLDGVASLLDSQAARRRRRRDLFQSHRVLRPAARQARLSAADSSRAGESRPGRRNQRRQDSRRHRRPDAAGAVWSFWCPICSTSRSQFSRGCACFASRATMSSCFTCWIRPSSICPSTAISCSKTWKRRICKSSPTRAPFARPTKASCKSSSPTCASSATTDSIDYQLISTSTPLDQALASYLSWRG